MFKNKNTHSQVNKSNTCQQVIEAELREGDVFWKVDLIPQLVT